MSCQLTSAYRFLVLKTLFLLQVIFITDVILLQSCYIITALFYFVDRVSIKESSVAKLGSVCRRVYRIFSHAYFHHRGLFDEYEVCTPQCFYYYHMSGADAN